MRLRMTLVLGTAVLLTAAAPENASKKELEKFQGTWKLVSMEAEGSKVEENVFKGSKLTIKGDKVTMTSPGDAVYQGVFKFDLSHKPKRLDLSFTDGPEKGNTSLGIYEIDGETFKVCLGLTGKPRPQEFVTKAGSGHVLEVWKKEKK